jgi:hypothetical protein
MSYNDDEQVEERSFRLSDDEDMEDPIEPLEETGDFVFDEETDEDPDKDH